MSKAVPTRRSLAAAADDERLALRLAAIEDTRLLERALEDVGNAPLVVDYRHRAPLLLRLLHEVELRIWHRGAGIVEPFANHDAAVAGREIGGLALQPFLYQRMGEQSMPQRRKLQRSLVPLGGGEDVHAFLVRQLG